jgi:hypothetical protein
MAVATLPALTLDGVKGASFGTFSTRVLLPGTNVSGDTLAVVTNVGTVPVYILLGGNTVTSTVATGSPVMPGQQRVYAIGSATYLAGIIQGGSTYFSGPQGILVVETGN